MKVFKHTSDSNPYGFRMYFCNVHEDESSEMDGGEEFCDLLKTTLKNYREGNAQRLLHEIAHCIFSSDNPEQTARMFFCAGEMYTLLKNIADRHEICTMSDIHELLTIIDGKEVD